MTIRRRYDRWPAEERARIVAESFSPGETIAQVARRNGVGLGLLHYWRRQARNSGAVEELRFVPLTLTSEPKSGSGGSIPTVVTSGRTLFWRLVFFGVAGAGNTVPGNSP